MKTGEGIEDYSNVPLTDFEIVESTDSSYSAKEFKIEILEDDLFDGFSAGDVFDAVYEEDFDEYVFTDHDGDTRVLEDYDYKKI